jgi:DNA repair protein RadC
MQKPHDKRDLQAREKLLTYGAEGLSDAELLAVFISSGSKHSSCLQIAENLMRVFGNLRAVVNAEYKNFIQVKGLGAVRFVQLQAAREICRRNDFIKLKKDTPLTNTRHTIQFIKRALRDRKNETFVALFLDTHFHIISYETLFHGTLSTAVIHIRPLIERVLNLNAAGIIIAHNHPSGLCEPSEQDRLLTKKIAEALLVVEAKLLDHLVIGDNEVYSILYNTKWPCN